MFNNLMIFAAGLGTRMLPLTNTQPKSLVKIKGKPILYYCLEEALNFGFTNIVINTHHLADQIKESIDFFIHNNSKAKGRIIVIKEEILLETGGAIKNANNYFDNNIIFTLNSDSFTINPFNIFDFIAAKWQNHMRALMLLHKVDNAIGYEGQGDFYLQDNNEIRIASGLKPYVYTGIQLLNIDHILAHPKQKFSLGEFFQNDQNIYGIVNPGEYYHLTNMQNIIDIENKIIC